MTGLLHASEEGLQGSGSSAKEHSEEHHRECSVECEGKEKEGRCMDGLVGLTCFCCLKSWCASDLVNIRYSFIRT